MAVDTGKEGDDLFNQAHLRPLAGATTTNNARYQTETAMTIPAMDNGVMGIQNGLQGMAKAASTIASGTQSPADLTEALVALKAQAVLVEASAKVLQTSDDAMGAILDIMI